MKQIKEGMRVKHKFIDEELIVVADEKGPAYTGNEFKDNEISLSHAQQELKNSLLEIIQNESKEVKEGGELFTGGEWEVNPNGNIEALIGIDALDTPPPLIAWINKEVSESEANAALIAQSKNMYYCLKDFMDIVKGISSVPVGSQLTVTIPASLFENASIVLQKATPKK